VLAAGCATERETVTIRVTETESDELAQRCEHEDDGYSVAYPATWHTESCAFFHPDEFEAPERTELLGVAIVISREPVAFDAITSDQPTREGVSSEELEVAGRPAVRLEYESTGDGLLPEGTPVYEVLVDLGGETLIAGTRGLGELDFEANKAVLDRMVESLRLGEG
jgi:hypothetical protein